MDFLAYSRYLLGTEYPTKLARAVTPLPPSTIWWRPNAESNSIGNLLLHLNGNVRQWIIGGVGGRDVTRDRAAEFAAREGAAAGELLAGLGATIVEADAVLAGFGADELSRGLRIQGRDVTVQQAVYHVVEHFAMHTGQILLLVKMQAPGSIHFYEEAGGLARPIWKDGAPR
jgi:uncharacterized damage-inducible protein DinB